MHEAGGKIALQILHAGRYAYHPLSVSASSIKAPINPFRPRALTGYGVRRQIRAFADCAALAREAGYDGVEIMGSEGYLINQFLAERTNKRTDAWGGTPEKRRRFAVEIVKRTREKVGDDFIIIYRLSMLDLVPGGQRWEDVVALAKDVEAAGATIINTGIGWHEARVPTIVTSVPRAAFTWVTGKLKPHVEHPGRHVEPDQHAGGRRGGAGERRRRPGVDGAAVPRRSRVDPQGRDRPRGRDQHLHRLQPGLPRPRLQAQARVLHGQPARGPRDDADAAARPGAAKHIAVVGAGPAGLSAATALAERGHSVELFEADDEIGGQFGIAREDPRQGGVRRDDPLLPAASRGDRREAAPRHPRRPRPT